MDGIQTDNFFLEIDTTQANDDLASYGLSSAKEGEFYAFKVIKRENNRIWFNLVPIKPSIE